MGERLTAAVTRALKNPYHDRVGKFVQPDGVVVGTYQQGTLAPEIEERLSTLEAYGGRGSVKVPFKIATGLMIAVPAPAEVTKHGTPTQMRLKDLTATTHAVDLDHVRRLLAARVRPRAGTFRLPIVVRQGHRNLLVDGHHRLVARWARGYDSALVQLVSAQDLQRPPTKLTADVKATLLFIPHGRSLSDVVADALDLHGDPSRENYEELHPGGEKESPAQQAQREHDARQRTHRVAQARRSVAATAERFGFDASRINIVDEDPREFEVNGMKLKEAGHFNPMSNMIQINARPLDEFWMDDLARDGVVTHEIMHAQEDTVFKESRSEHDHIKNLWNTPDGNRLFKNNGYPRDGAAIAELERRFPASAAMAKAFTDGYLGAWSKGEDGKWKFDDKELSDRFDALEKDDGSTAYSRLYWQQYNKDKAENPGGVGPMVKHRQAMQETLAETARYLETARRGSWKEGVPSKRWMATARVIQDAYTVIMAKRAKERAS